jgi:hypothetical protein
MPRIVLSACLVLLLAAPVSAQQRPLVTEDPETVGSGLILFEAGFDHQREAVYPVAGLTGSLLRLPTLGVSFGLSSIAELQIDGGLYTRLSITDRVDAPLSSMLDIDGDQTTAIDDLVIGTKIRLLSENPGRPSVGVRLATKLPNASNESGLGLDTTDFYASLLIGKTVQSIRVVGNAGLGILGDPTRGDQQNDVLTYGFSLARAVQQGLEVVGELNGHLHVRDADPAPGTDTRGSFRVGARYTYNTVRLDGGLIIGMTARDPSFGFTAGLTWVFRGFTIP